MSERVSACVRERVERVERVTPARTPLALPPKTASRCVAARRTQGSAASGPAGQQRLVVFAHLRVPTHPLVVPPLARDVQRSLQLGPQRRHAAQRASAHGEPRRSVAAGVI